jgi:phosphatidate cytidylyltransferase
MTDLARRSATAAVYGVIVLVAIAAPPVVFFVLLMAAAVIGLTELRALQRAREWPTLSAAFFAGLVSLGVLRAMGALGARAGTPGEVPVWLLLVIIPTWAGDVLAYLVGSAIGSRRLAPRVSPGKTWEGTIAGLVGAGAAAIGIATIFGLPRAPATIVALGIGTAGLVGDLFESSVKRSAGVKDSGTILPGHGGILDRLDSLTAGAMFTLIVVVAWGATTLGSERGTFDRF